MEREMLLLKKGVGDFLSSQWHSQTISKTRVHYFFRFVGANKKLLPLSNFICKLNSSWSAQPLWLSGRRGETWVWPRRPFISRSCGAFFKCRESHVLITAPKDIRLLDLASFWWVPFPNESPDHEILICFTAFEKEDTILQYYVWRVLLPT